MLSLDGYKKYLTLLSICGIITIQGCSSLGLIKAAMPGKSYKVLSNDVNGVLTVSADADMSADYLLYALIDIIVDNYFEIIEKIGKKIDRLEDSLIEEPKIELMQSIHLLKREMIDLKKLIWHSRNVISNLQRGYPSIKDTTLVYIRDIYDHIIQIIDAFENFRDIISGLIDIYLSSLSNKMNEIMKILTIISTILNSNPGNMYRSVSPS